MRLTISNKLIVACLLFGLVPLLCVAVVIWRTAGELEIAFARNCQMIATQLGDTIDRNLYERYGDAQAFASNRSLLEKTHWHQPGEANPIVRAMNKYIDVYDVYYLTLLVDAQGRLIAVNTRDEQGRPIETTKLYEQDYAQEPWFQAALAGKFLQSADGACSGTVVEDFHVDPQVKEIYHDDGFALAFSAPVKDDQGEVVAVWRNVARFALVEEVVAAYYRELKGSKMGASELTVLDSKGRVIIDYDPTLQGGEQFKHDPQVIGKLNLAEKQVPAAVRAVQGESGALPACLHARKQIAQTAGFARTKGALGFPGMKWPVMVRVPTSESMMAVNSLKASLFWTAGLASLLIATASYFMARSIVRPIQRVVDRLRDMAQGEGDLTQRLLVASRDELGEMARWFNLFVERIQTLVVQIAANSHTLTAASQQLTSTATALHEGAEKSTAQSATVSAAAEEMSINMQTMAGSTEQMSSTINLVARSIEEMNSTINEIARSAERSAQVASEASQLAATSDREISELGVAAEEIGRVVQLIQDIADQTNLLALNATIEAARAGESGKGFAVVASEVKELARQTSSATVDIRKRVATIQASTEGAIKTVQAISQVIVQVNQTAQSIAAAVEEQSVATKEISGNISQSASVAIQVSRSVEESASASQEITRNITSVDQVLRQTALNSAESKAAGEELARLASTMQKQVSQFKIENNAATIGA